MYDGVNPARQLAEQDLPLVVFQVQGDAFLAGVELEEEAAALAVGNVSGKGSTPARGVTGQRRFRLDDLGAQSRQQLAAEGPGHHGGYF